MIAPPSSWRPPNGPISPRRSLRWTKSGRSVTQTPAKLKYRGSSDSQSKTIASPIATTSRPPMTDTACPWRTSGRRTAGARSQDERDREERQSEPDRVGDEQDRALGDGRARRRHRQDRAEDHADAGCPADREDRAEPERGEPAPALADEPATEPVADRRRGPGPERHRPGRRRDGRRRPRVERPPGPIQGGHPEDPGEVQAEQDQDDRRRPGGGPASTARVPPRRRSR